VNGDSGDLLIIVRVNGRQIIGSVVRRMDEELSLAGSGVELLRLNIDANRLC